MQLALPVLLSQQALHRCRTLDATRRRPNFIVAETRNIVEGEPPGEWGNRRRAG